jgi:hypothetical protein
MLRYFTTNIRKESDANIRKFRRLIPSEEAATTSKESAVVVPAHELTYSRHRAAYVTCILVSLDADKRLAIPTAEMLVKFQQHISFR